MSAVVDSKATAASAHVERSAPSSKTRAITAPPGVKSAKHVKGASAAAGASSTTPTARFWRAPIYTAAELLKARGANAAKEESSLSRMVKFIKDSGMRLKLPQLSIASAIVFFHRFYAEAENRAAHKLHAAIAALFLATKVEETPTKLHYVMCACMKLLKGHEAGYTPLVADSDECKRLRRAVLHAEMALLRTLGFNVEVDHPYRHLMMFMDRINPHIEKLAEPKRSEQMARRKQLAQRAWSVLNDSLMTTLCLRYAAPRIAAAAIYLSARSMSPPYIVDEHGASDEERKGATVLGGNMDELRAIGTELVALYDANDKMLKAKSDSRSRDGSGAEQPSGGAVGGADADLRAASSQVPRSRTGAPPSGNGDAVIANEDRSGGGGAAKSSVVPISGVRRSESTNSLNGKKQPPPPPSSASAKQQPPPPLPPSSSSTSVPVSAAPLAGGGAAGDGNDSLPTKIVGLAAAPVLDGTTSAGSAFGAKYARSGAHHNVGDTSAVRNFGPTG